jgi:hypothetical protein
LRQSVHGREAFAMVKRIRRSLRVIFTAFVVVPLALVAAALTLALASRPTARPSP